MNRALGLFLVAVTLIGCGGSSLDPVEGVVTFDGQPLAGATIALGPLKATDPGPFMGTTDAQGRYKLGTAEEPESGAAPGEYFVNITTVKPAPVVDEGAPPKVEKEIIPMAYRDSTQRIVIPEGGTSAANFDISSR
jgi:hypothetical protein